MCSSLRNEFTYKCSQNPSGRNILIAVNIILSRSRWATLYCLVNKLIKRFSVSWEKAKSLPSEAAVWFNTGLPSERASGLLEQMDVAAYPFKTSSAWFLDVYSYVYSEFRWDIEDTILLITNYGHFGSVCTALCTFNKLIEMRPSLFQA